MNNCIYKLWGKTEPYNSLICHMIDVGCVAQELLIHSGFDGLRSKFAQEMQIEEEELVEWMGFIIALHDIGKCHPDFQGKVDNSFNDELRKSELMKKSINSVGVKEFRHELYINEWAYEYFEQKCGVPLKVTRIINDILMLHHWKHGESEKIWKGYRNFWLDIQNELAETLKLVFVSSTFKCTKILHKNVFSTLMEGLLILSDWIASNNELMQVEGEISDAKAYYLKSRKKARKVIKKLGLVEKNVADFGNEFLEVWSDIREKGFEVRPIQAECEKITKQDNITSRLLIIEAPMGEGKTEAAIYTAVQWIKAYNLSGFYIALPTSATSNQMYERVKHFFCDHAKGGINVKLVHGLAWLLDKQVPEKLDESKLLEERLENDIAYKWFQPARRSLLAPFGIGTVDQVMMAALFVKFGVLRLFGLANKVLIIDEVHAYDVFMSTIIKRLLNWCGVLEIPVIMLSATLPSDKKKELLEAYGANISSEPGIKGYPLMTWVDENNEIIENVVDGASVMKEVKVYLEKGLLNDWEAVSRAALKEVIKGGCLCIILNTVKEAQQLYKNLQDIVQTELQDIEVILFHARYCVEDRNRIEKKCLESFDKSSLFSKNHENYHERPERSILIATQVVEQSIDLDFDVMFSAIAPIDLLLQRMGRLHRHNRGSRPTGNKPIFRILLPEKNLDFGTTEKIYHKYILNKTTKCLEKWGDVIHIPQDLKPLVEMVYSKSFKDTDEELINQRKIMEEKEEKEQVEGKKHLIQEPNNKEFWLSEQIDINSSQNEDSALSYFHAQTRLGGQTERVILVEEKEWKLLQKTVKNIDKEKAKKVLQKMVSLPKWWLHEVNAEENFECVKELEEGILKWYKILIMREGMWKGKNNKGKVITINKDKVLGITMEGSDE